MTSSSDEKLAKVRATYGADEGVNYKKFPEWSKQVLQVTGGHGADFISKHRLRPVVDRVFPFEQHADALRYLESGDSIGKVVIRVGAGDPAGR